jgi:diguanylate cyclase (GGDEF)-like protein
MNRPQGETYKQKSAPKTALLALAGLSLALGFGRRKARQENSRLRDELLHNNRAMMTLRQKNEELEYKATHDNLTGLLTKHTFMEKADRRLQERHPEQVFAMLVIDLDNFKAINDKHAGRHAAGDEVLKIVGETLKNATRQEDDQRTDLLAHGRRQDAQSGRWGGDEFAVFVELTSRHDESLSPEARLKSFKTRLEEGLSKPFETRGDLMEHGFGISVAGSLAQPGDTAETMFNRADQLLGTVKEEHHQANGNYRLLK